MNKRAEQVEETRQRITEAAMRLHASIGPAKTTISAVAEEADVTRLTVYRHFPDEEQLFLACSSHWAMLHPAPEPRSWTDIEDFQERCRKALTDLYGFYLDNHRDLYLILRDFEAMPLAFQSIMRTRQEAYRDAIIKGSGIRGRRRARLRAVVGHVTSFGTWRSLVVEQGMEPVDAVTTALDFVLTV